ncbi:hypothetical protein WICPIJ_009069 [Wickerhamomyces pijperi]|uniref:Uncharacterized protein n=1 Tax=Wickerhamomyces pijperi TaxID=599730 RepID=A0A9P8TF38_WICPI|nr:hypothetical protein WICPIJ_009069 [Wickerhamomyces pijperi]
MDQFLQVDVLKEGVSAQDKQPSHSTVCVTAMSFIERTGSNTTLICLTSPNPLSGAFDKLLCQDVQSGSDSQHTVNSPCVTLTTNMHTEGPIFILQSHKPLVHGLTVNLGPVLLCTDVSKGQHTRISSSDMANLPRTTTDTSI